MKNLPIKISHEEKILWIQLLFTKGIGPITFWKLLRESQYNIRKVIIKFDQETLCDKSVAEREFTEIEKRGFSLISAFEEEFPSLLHNLRDCPPLISVAGDMSILNKKPTIAIVGARNASFAGKLFAKQLASKMGQEGGFVTVSGFARGIDSVVHESSLKTGTIAVLAGGLDVIYPAENKNLYEAIIKNKGAIISEMPLGTAVDATLFPRRNRLVAGLSCGVVLVEAAKKSGSLITAQYALEQGKEVFAVPGFPSDYRSNGCNMLIKQGATLIESAADVFEAIPFDWESRFSKKIISEKRECFEYYKQEEFSKEILCGKGNSSSFNKIKITDIEIDTETNSDENLKKSILSNLSKVPLNIDILFQTQSCCFSKLLSILTELEVNGKIIKLPNNEIVLNG